MCYRGIARSTDERTIISTVVPPNRILEVKCTCIDVIGEERYKKILLLPCFFNSFVCDFIFRFKVSANVNMFHIEQFPILNNIEIYTFLLIRSARLMCIDKRFSDLWKGVYISEMAQPSFWYPKNTLLEHYGPAHEIEIRKRLRDEAPTLTQEWGPHCGVYDKLPDRRDTGDRAQLRAEIDAYVAHLYGLSRDDFSYIFDSFPVLKNKEMKAFGEFMSKRKCLEEYDRIEKVLE
jgi:hypothetical protein